MTADTSPPAFRPPAPVAVGDMAGWLHPGDGRRAVLLCGPIGFEALCCRQSLNVLGDLLAREGVTALRFDYPGEGDSLDRRAGQDLVSAAIAAIGAAERWLRQLPGVDEIGVVGLRMGAPLMLQAFAGRDDIRRIALLAPLASGRSFLRETRMAAQVVRETRAGTAGGEGALDLCGFAFTDQDVASLGTLATPHPPADAAIYLALEPDRDRPAFLERPFAENRASEAVFRGYAAMNVSPTHSATPFADLQAVARWFADRAPAGQAPAVTPGGPLRGDGFTESALRFGPDQTLAGVLCEPRSAPSRRPLVHLLNAGANPHTGWARMSVEHARALAAEGVASLRYDFTGVGDSAWTPEGARPLIYSDRHVADGIAAVEAMSRRGYERHVLAGLCAGGYVAFHAAARDPRIAGAIVANALRLVWHPGDALDALEREMLQPTAVYTEKAFSAAQWRRILRGEISPARILRVAAAFAGKGLASLAGALGHKPAVDADAAFIRETLLKISGRGARVAFLHAERDLSRDESDRHFGPAGDFARRQPGVTFTDIPGSDHELTPRGARDAFLDAIRSVALGK